MIQYINPLYLYIYIWVIYQVRNPIIYNYIYIDMMYATRATRTSLSKQFMLRIQADEGLCYCIVVQLFSHFNETS